MKSLLPHSIRFEDSSKMLSQLGPLVYRLRTSDSLDPLELKKVPRSCSTFLRQLSSRLMQFQGYSDLHWVLGGGISRVHLDNPKSPWIKQLLDVRNCAQDTHAVAKFLLGAWLQSRGDRKVLGMIVKFFKS
ncbi:hypothetical protein HJG60_010610 [Phyllostomus discolor]|uniref:Uncharacterized protein n=1 Tax=Phyllostomus discolor TaxID=89673 RepID=A0A834EBE7_9CHIR|nr:hypothetical protein HJG60_010610 [Phyllostomus discolor]